MKRLTLRFCVLAVLLSAAGVRANDSGIEGVGGRWRLIKGEHRSVRMVSERVEMDVYARDYRVRAAFVFRNDGPATTVTMGFPEAGYGDAGDGRRTSFRDFATTVDGTPTSARRVIVEGNEGLYQAHWLKTVPFRRGQSRRVLVSYRAPLGSSVARGYEHFAIYNFTGGNWRGTVSRAELAVRLRTPGTWAVLPEFGGKPLTMRARNTTLSYAWRDWQAQNDFNIGLVRTVEGWMTTTETTGPFGEQKGTQTITVPGRSSSEVEYAPPAMLRDGRTWLRLTSLRDAMSEKLPAREVENGSQLQVYLTGVAKTNTAVLEIGPRSYAFRPGSRAMEVVGKGTRERVMLPAPPFVLPCMMGNAMYVPASVVGQLGGSFDADPARHTLRLAF